MRQPAKVFDEWFRYYYKVDPTTNCWVWSRAKTGSGYGAITLGKPIKTLLAHRVSYELFVGKIPDGLEIDHLCRNRTCVNPEHMEVVTAKENLARGYSPSAINTRKTHCSKGHLLEGDNLYTVPRAGKEGVTYRRCRICHNAYQLKYQRENRARLRKIPETGN